MKVILPKVAHKIDPAYGPLFFLAGPVLGGDDWQYECVKELQKHLEHFYVAIPIRYTNHPLLEFRAPHDHSTVFSRQKIWERHYLALAAQLGCIIFWLPPESKTNPRMDGNPYARDSYGEVGEWRGRMMCDNLAKVVVGGKHEFPGLELIEVDFNEALKGNFVMYYTLESTVQAAVRKACKRT